MRARDSSVGDDRCARRRLTGIAAHFDREGADRVAAYSGIVELDVNPLVASHAGVLALDGRIISTQAGVPSHRDNGSATPLR
jgi:hypothetical protein